MNGEVKSAIEKYLQAPNEKIVESLSGYTNNNEYFS